jgi:hypothetical protein
MKLFNDHPYTKAASTCSRIRAMCKKSIEKDRQNTGRIASISIKKFVKN